ncbi:MAG: TonB-dependent receptor, partial [Bacteroidota bacterium]|nr:TonB-dependent receptor [Bacteroidota bacterium]
IKFLKGSYNQNHFQGLLGNNILKSNSFSYYSYNESDGYRYNTDYINKEFFFKKKIFLKKIPLNFLSYFSDRKFGANGFYASPDATDQYEETQGSLVGLNSIINKNNLIIKPKVYWRRNQDKYIYVRNNPSIYRNLHLNNKIATSLDFSLLSNFGITGLGFEYSKIYLRSNNLGNRNREISNVFIEHLFYLFDSKIDLTIGGSYNNYSDFGNYFYPGIDLGVKLFKNVKFYSSFGSTFRIPSYTDLFYQDKTTIGNSKLVPESAKNYEFGFRLYKNKMLYNISIFKRNSENLIDYVKDDIEDLWQARNISSLNTIGAELDISGSLTESGKHKYNIGYTFIENSKFNSKLSFSKYAINSLKHHLIMNLNSYLNPSLIANISYRFLKRIDDDSYNIMDLSLIYNLSKWKFTLSSYNIFNQVYYETNLVPMPKNNSSFSIEYIF